MEWLFSFALVVFVGRIWSYRMHDPDTRPIPPKDYDERRRAERQYDKEVSRSEHAYDKEVARTERVHDKELIKEALHEWLDDKYAQFGRWSLTGIAAAVLALIAYLLLTTHGWKAPI